MMSVVYPCRIEISRFHTKDKDRYTSIEICTPGDDSHQPDAQR